ncbi:Response regulator MprA [compost metagenome]
MSKKIFLCDDNIPILETLEMVLSMTDANIISESKSSEALGRLSEENPDLFICDLWMPDLSGEDLIKQIRTHREFDNMYILCISASYEGKEIALKAGADYFLPKPFEMNELLSIVNNVLASGRL